MSGSQSDTPQQEKPRHHGHFQAIPSEAGLSPLGPSGRDFCSETPGPAALKVQAGSRIGSLTAEPENGRCSLAQLKLQSLQHIPSNDFDLAEHRDNHSILGFESSFSYMFGKCFGFAESKLASKPYLESLSIATWPCGCHVCGIFEKGSEVCYPQIG